jgi:NlpC/P60 family
MAGNATRAFSLPYTHGETVVPRTACAIPLSLLVFSASPPASASDAVDFAASLIGRPYVWGAEGPKAFDCSGLTQYVFQRFGVDLPRRAISQSRVGDRTRALRRGDLVFFSTDPGDSLVTHVGIYEGRGVMIDASKRHGRVRRDDLNDEYWEDRFLFARRVTSGRVIDAGDDEVVVSRPRERTDRRRAAIRVLGRIAEELLRRPRR